MQLMRMRQHKHLLPLRHQVLHLCAAVSIDETPTEPATSPRVMEVPVNDGRWTQAEYAALVRRA